MLMASVASAMLGIYVGAMTGFSVEPVVKGVLQAALALVAAFFGLGGHKVFRRTPDGAMQDARIAVFFLMATLATLGSLYARTHDLLSPAGVVVTGKDDPHATILFSFQASAAECVEFIRVSDRPVADQIAFLRSAGGTLTNLAERISAFPPERQAAALAAGRALLCGK